MDVRGINPSVGEAGCECGVTYVVILNEFCFEAKFQSRHPDLGDFIYIFILG